MIIDLKRIQAATLLDLYRSAAAISSSFKVRQDLFLCRLRHRRHSNETPYLAPLADLCRSRTKLPRGGCFLRAASPPRHPGSSAPEMQLRPVYWWPWRRPREGSSLSAPAVGAQRHVAVQGRASRDMIWSSQPPVVLRLPGAGHSLCSLLKPRRELAGGAEQIWIESSGRASDGNPLLNGVPAIHVVLGLHSARPAQDASTPVLHLQVSDLELASDPPPTSIRPMFRCWYRCAMEAFRLRPGTDAPGGGGLGATARY